MDMFLMIHRVIGINEDVAYVNSHAKSRRSLKMLFMKHWKAAGALVSPNGITSHSKEL